VWHVSRHLYIAWSLVSNTSEVLPIGTIALMALGKPVMMVYLAPVAVSSWEPSVYAMIEWGSWCRRLRSLVCAQVALGFVTLEMSVVIGDRIQGSGCCCIVYSTMS
jgi:hypothetical protein